MFVHDADMTCLRQGDILRFVPFPLLSASELGVLGRIDPQSPALSVLNRVIRDDPNWMIGQLPIRLSFCCITSHCCDLELRNEKFRMPAFALARLIPIPRSIAGDTQALASLRANKDPRDASNPGFINFFHVPAHPSLDNKEWVVDYNQVVSIPGREFPAILENKILQLEDEWRVKFKIKLAANVGRITDEEIRAGLKNPWVGKQKPIKFPE